MEVVGAAELRIEATMVQLEASKAVALDVLGTKDAAQQELDVLACMVAGFTASQSRKAEHVATIEKQLADAEVPHLLCKLPRGSLHLACMAPFSGCQDTHQVHCACRKP